MIAIMVWLVAAVSLGALGAREALADAADDRPTAQDPYAIVRGMTLSCHRSGQTWATDATVESMAELRAMGVNWVAIHPYAGIRGDGTVTMWSAMYRDDTTWLTRPIAEAHRLGLKIMIKPHIAYWGSPFRWRGEIAFETERQWERFFATYERWITRVAELCADADALIVGTELDRTIAHELEWRRIIEAVRARIDAPLSYAANWDRYEQVPFWDALDAIGVQGYFPLVGHDRVPSQEELTGAWMRVIRRLDEFGARHRRNVFLGELGYNRSSRAAKQPWDSTTGGVQAELVQRRCLTAALTALERSDRVVGAFLWKWFPIGRMRGNFLMTTPAMREVIREHWAAARIEPRVGVVEVGAGNGDAGE